MSPEPKSRFVGSYQYQGHRHLKKRVSLYISRTIYLTTKGVETFFLYIINFIIFFVYDFFL